VITLNHRVSLVIGEDGSTMAHVHELMGCFALSRSKSRALEKLVAVIPQYHQWLAEHGESTTIPKHVELTVVEEVDARGSAGSAGGPDPLRDCDRVPATNQDIERCLKLLKYTRDDLNQVITKLPKAAFSFKPTGEPRSVRNTLRHMADVDVWYLSRINADPPLDEPKRRSLLGWLKYTRSLVEETLPNLTTEQLPRETTHRLSQENPELAQESSEIANWDEDSSPARVYSPHYHHVSELKDSRCPPVFSHAMGHPLTDYPAVVS